MLSHAYLDEPRTGTTRGPLYAICNAVRVHRRSVWIICASISLLSARHLLVEQNIHYPLQLYFSQLAVTGFIALWPYHGWQATWELFRERSQPRRPMTRGTVLIIASMCFTSLSTICTLQAILHLQNLPTLVMMIMIAFFAEGLLLLIIQAAPRSRAELLRISLLLFASAGLLFTEYRLTVPSLAASIPAMLLAGVARALWKTAIKYYPEVAADNRNQISRYVIIGALVGVTWVLVFWKSDRIFAFDSGNFLLFAINTLASALALILGKSMLLPMDDEVADLVPQTANAPVHHIWDALTLVVLTGIVGCHSTLSIRRSYTNAYQFCCFLFAIICIGSRACVDVFSAQPKKPWITPSTYELINTSLVPSAGDSDTVGFAEEANHPETPALLSSPQNNNMFRKLLLGISIALLWTAYGVLNSTERLEHRIPALLDRDYVPQSSVEIVVSMYKEPVDEVSRLVYNLRSMPALSDANLTIYIKDNEADHEDIKQRTGADRIITLPNVGREGETFLNHILTRWHSLARQTIFLQAGIHNPREFYAHINNYYSLHETGFLNLGWSGVVCNCEDCSDRMFWRDNTHIFPQVYNQIYNSTTCNNVLLSYKGQFIVSAARIRGINKDIYHNLWQAFVNKESWAHQPEYLQGRPDSMNAPDFGYTMERMWNLLFQCSSTSVAWKCPSLISRWRIGGDISDCQCFDT